MVENKSNGKNPAAQDIQKWFLNWRDSLKAIDPPEWFEHAALTVASRLTRLPLTAEARSYKIGKQIVAIAIAAYAIVVTVCLVRLFWSMIEGSADDINKLLLALGGVIGGPFLIWRSFIARDQAEIAREGNYTTLFTTAVEQLGASRENKTVVETLGTDDKIVRETITKTEPNLEVRLGAIYALERIARDSQRDHRTIMEVLSAYVRNRQNTGEPVVRPKDALPETKQYVDWMASIPRARLDVQAAITVIGRRPIHRSLEKGRKDFINLEGANLQRITISRVNFANTHLGRAHLECSNIRLNTNLARSFLNRVNFDGARIDDSNLSDIWAVGCSFVGTLLQDCNLTNAGLFNCDLTTTRRFDFDAISGAQGDITTKLPDNIQRPKSWPDRELSSEERQSWMTTKAPPKEG